MKGTVAGLAFAIFPWLCLIADAAEPLRLTFPPAGTAVLTRVEGLTSYPLPIGAFSNGTLPLRTVEGQVRQTVWRIDQPGQSTLDILLPLRGQLIDQGFQILFECEAVQCGGFDFRYGLQILPEPEMHVDLGDFRFLAAERDDEVASLIVSKSAAAGFVQVVSVTKGQPPLAQTEPQPTASAIPLRAEDTTRPVAGRLDSQLKDGGAVILAGLDFASGTSDLPAGTYPSLDRLADWLKSNPDMTIAVVGHTDASGGLDGNIALSRKRALSVRQYLIREHGISPERIEAQGVGYLAPIASNLTEEGRQKNRRVEAMLTSTQVQP